MERWRIVKDYPNYMVSDLGKVKNIVTGRILKPQNNKRGYLHVILRSMNLNKTIRIHTLVAITFLNYNADGTQKIVVDHINNNTLDNRLVNLQLITQRKNTSKDKNRSLPTGVYLTPRNRYVATIGINNKACYLGSFDTPEAASAAYQEALSNL